MVPIDIHIYALNTNTGEWYHRYSFREQFGLPDLSPSSVKALLETMY